MESGLKEKEALIYDILLQNGTLPAGDVIKKTGLKRGIVYKILYDLEEKGLITQLITKNKLHFRAEHPYKLAEYIDDNLKQLQNNQLTIQTYLPQLISAFKSGETKPGVKILEGVKGIMEVYKDTLKEGQEISAILQTSEVDPTIYDWLEKTYAAERTKKGIFAKVIVADDAKTESYMKKDEIAKRETRRVPKETFPIGIEVDIYGNKVAFINFHRDRDLVGIIIQNELIANTMRCLFNLAWDGARKYQG